MIDREFAALGLTEAQARQVDEQSDTIELDYGEQLFDQDADDPSIALVLDGEVVLELDDEDIDTVTPGAMLGASQLLGARRRLYKSRTLGATRLRALPVSAYEALRADGNPAAWHLERVALKTLSEHLRVLDERLSAHLDSIPLDDELPTVPLWERFTSLWQGRFTKPDVREALAVLRGSALFEGASDEALAELASRVEAVAYEVAQPLFVEGTPPTHIHLLVQGAVQVFTWASEGRVVSLGTAQPISVIGLTSHLCGTDHMATALCAETSVAIRIDVEHWAALFDRDDRIGSDVRRAGIRYLTSLVKAVHDRYAAIVRTRVAALRADASHLYDTPGPVTGR